jgi:hypothetical protein
MADRTNLRRQFGKLAESAVVNGTPTPAQAPAPVIDVQVLPDHPATSQVKDLAKPDAKQLANKSSKVNISELFPEFEGMQAGFSGFVLKAGAPKVKIVTPDEEVEAESVKVVFLTGKECWTLWDASNKKFYKSYNKSTVGNGQTMEEIEALTGGQFRYQYEFELAVPGYDEVFTFLTSTTAKYRFMEYAASLAERGLKPSMVFTKVSTNYNTSDKGNYFAPVFEFAGEVK